MSGILQAVFADHRGFATVPGAPTIGTATATGATTATVAFTAPASNGGSTITSYTATSSPGGITGTLSQSGSGTITVTGLTASTSYTFTVKATNGVGQSAASSASNSITTIPSSWPGVIGSAYQGGYFGGQINVSSVVYNLVVADAASGQSNGVRAWGTSGTTTNITSPINGPTNSAAIAALYSDTATRSAAWCESLSIGGYSDWYLPAINELITLYWYMKPKDEDNNLTGSPGSTANAVAPQPISTLFTTTSPGQTTAAAFKFGTGAERFLDGAYWSSTEFSDTQAYTQLFSNGRQLALTKDTTSYVTRAVRRVLA
jgi:hypothetical protein